MYFSIATMFLIGGLTQVHSSPVSHYHNHTVCEDNAGDKFAVHARTTITFAGVTSIVYDGDIGVYPGTSITGSYLTPTGGVVRDSDFADHVVGKHASAMAAYPQVANMAIEIGNEKFEPGTHRSGSAINFAHGTVVTLDGAGEYTFIAGTTLITAADTTFILKNGAKAENVLWVLGTAATLGARSVVPGSIMAGTAITFGTNSKLYGCALAQSAVTFESEGSVINTEYPPNSP